MRQVSEIRVRFRDTDMFGHVNNAVYFTYMEEARIHLMEALELSPAPLIMASAKVDFRGQTFFRDVIVIETWVSRMGNSSFDISSKMMRKGTNEVLFEGTAAIVYFDYEAQRPVSVPPDMREKLQTAMD